MIASNSAVMLPEFAERLVAAGVVLQEMFEGEKQAQKNRRT